MGDFLNQSIFNLIKRNRWLFNALYSCQEKRCQNFLSRIESQISPGSSVLDLGSGTCNMTAILRHRGIHATPLDIVDLSLVEGIVPVIYDGAIIPFADDHFDAAIILTVLHHCTDPEQIIREASRVARKLIIIEDVVRSPLHSILTKSFDSLLNLEFAGHPHQNKTDQQWCSLFDKLGLRLIEKKDTWSFGVMWQVTYILSPF